jgi:hypothetical protein
LKGFNWLSFHRRRRAITAITERIGAIIGPTLKT